MPDLFLQRDQPPGVPPLALDGERTLPDIPEENYWFRRHLVVYEWIARRVGGVRVVDLACGEGYGSDVLARSAYSVVGVDANPDAHEHARLRYRAPNLRFVRNMVETFSESCDAVVFLQTIEHVHDPDGVLENVKGMLQAGGTAYVSTPNVLTLAPKGAERSGNPWHLREYRAEEFRALCAAHFGSVELYGLFHARRLRAHELALRAGWDRVHAALRLTAAVLRPLRARDLDPRLRPALRARPRPRAGLRRRAEAMSDGRLAVVLHSHLPYVEGFGTWPFGEEWLWEAIATSYLPLLDVLRAGAPVTLSLTPVLCDQLEAPGAIERCRAFLRDVRPASHALDIEAADDPAVAAELERAAGEYAGALQRLPDDLLGRAGALRGVDERRHARAPAAAGHRRGRAPAGAHRGRVAPGALRRRLARRLLAAGVRPRAVAGRVARGGRRARDVRRPHRRLRPGRPAPPAPAGQRGGAAARAHRSRGGRPRVGARAAIRRTRAYRDHHRRTARDHHPWANDGAVYDPARAAEQAARDAADFVARVGDGACATAGCACARWTPSCSGTGGTRARSGWSSWSPRRSAPGSSSSISTTRWPTAIRRRRARRVSA